MALRLQGFVKSILDVADNLERAAAAVPPNALSEEPGAPAPDAAQLRALLKGLLEGVSATERILLNVSGRIDACTRMRTHACTHTASSTTPCG